MRVQGGGIQIRLDNENGGWDGDTDLSEVSGGITTQNASSIEFVFTAPSNEIKIDYIMASNEYGKFECSNSFGDSFGFFLTEQEETSK